MDKFTHRENILLGYSPQRSFANPAPSSPKNSYRNSEIDFHDVFGGPPRRRSSIHEVRYSSSETMDDDEVLESRSSRSGLGEKPVFGEEAAYGRRHPSDDFYDDIFKGDESASSTPRKHDRDPFSSIPGSRVLSPARPLPPKSEPFGSSSLPAQLSLPARMAKGIDLPAFGSSTHSPYKYKDGTSLSRFSSQSSQAHDDLKTDIQSSSRTTLLSPEEVRLSSDEPITMIDSDKADRESTLRKTVNSSEDSICGSQFQFHFSIYKWASKGVPLVMPLRGGNARIVTEDNVGRSPKSTLRNNVEYPSNDNSIATIRSLKEELNKEETDLLLNASIRESEKPCQIIEEPMVPILDSENTNSFQSNEETGDRLYQTRVEMRPHSLDEVGLYDKMEKNMSVSTKEANKNNLKPLRSHLHDNDAEEGTKEISEKTGRKESTARNNKKSSIIAGSSKSSRKQDGEATNVRNILVDNASFKASPANTRFNSGKKRAGGKVKDFVKIFNQESSSKPKGDTDSQSRGSERKQRSITSGSGIEATVNTSRDDERISRPNLKSTLPDVPIKVVKAANKEEENSNQSMKEQYAVNTARHILNSTSSAENVPASSTEPILDDPKFKVVDTDDSFQENFMIKELPVDENRPVKTDDDHEEIKIIDDKIRKWSRGKEGNIRSLLSTLQYVLWPESGWKPVPLVNIIEGNAVKRSYQKALLCLHPDKLQQRGVAPHLKYTAEKVFDILQEAWTHFNTLGSV